MAAIGISLGHCRSILLAFVLVSQLLGVCNMVNIGIQSLDHSHEPYLFHLRPRLTAIRNATRRLGIACRPETCRSKRRQGWNVSVHSMDEAACMTRSLKWISTLYSSESSHFIAKKGSQPCYARLSTGHHGNGWRSWVGVADGD